jgi:peptidase M24-like protein
MGATDMVAAADLADIGYTAVMDHLYVGMPVQELADNVARSTRRAGGEFGWHAPAGADGPVAGSDLVSVRGFDADLRLTATTPVRFALHPVLRGQAGYAATTAVLSKADPSLRALGELAAEATRAMVGAIRPGEPLREAYEAFRATVRTSSVAVRSAGPRIFPLAEGGPGPELPPDGAVGISGALVAADGRAVEFGGVVLVSDSGADLVTRTPVRLVELY